MQEALRRESVEVVSHQLRVERDEVSRRRAADLMVSLTLAGAALAVGFQLYEAPKGRSR
jgi:hypothetical protein